MRRSPKDRRQTSRRYLVFLSHGSRDTWVAVQLAHHCEARGAKVFLDAVSIEAGGETDEVIRKALNAMDELLVLLTPWSMTRPYVWSELGVAWNRRVPIIGLLYGISKDELQRMPEIPHFLKGTNLKDLNDVDAYFTSLSRRCRRSPRRSP